MRWASRVAVIVFMATVGFCPAAMTALAQEQTSPEELNRRYNDTLNQLRAAQDRKNELATENEKLTARVTDLEKQLDEARRQAATFSEQTFRLRVHYAAWLSFVRRYPLLLEKWKLFVEGDPLAAPSSLPEMLDPTSPLSVP